MKIELLPAEGLTGEVTTKRREPIAGADVTLQTESGTRHARTNKDGVYSFAEVSAGPARVRVRAPGRAPDEKQVTIEERGGRKPTEVARFELAEEGIVEGVVVNDRGDPIPGARVAKDAVPTYLPVGTAPIGIATERSLRAVTALYFLVMFLRSNSIMEWRRLRLVRRLH